MVVFLSSDQMKACFLPLWKENKNLQNWSIIKNNKYFTKNWLYREQRPFEEKNRYKEQRVVDEKNYVICLKGCQATS